MLKKFFLSYLFVLTIPLVILSYITFGDILLSNEQEVLLSNINLLNRIQVVIDDQIDQLNNTASQLYSNTGISPFKLVENPLLATKVSKELLKYNVVNSFIDEIFIYYRGDHYMYSSSSSISLPLFINKIYNYDHWSENDFISTINNIDIPTFRPLEGITIASDTLSQRRENYITYICPLPTYRYKPLATAIFHIPEKSIKNLINETAKTYNISTIILDEQNNILLNSDENNLEFITELINELINTHGSYTKTTTVNNIEFLVSKVESSKNGLKYITVVPSSEVLYKVNIFKAKLFYGILIILLLGFFAILLSMRINYNPIKKLKQFSEEKLNGKNSLSEIDTIHLALEQLSSTNGRLSSRLLVNRHAIKELLAQALLKGHIRSTSEFEHATSHFGVASSMSNCFSAIIYIPGYSKKSKTEAMKTHQFLESCMPDELFGFVCDDLMEDCITLFLLTNAKATTDITNLLAPVRQRILEVYAASSLCCFGKIYNDISMMHLSYMEAYTTFNHFFSSDFHGIHNYSEFMDFIRQSDLYPNSELEYIRQSAECSNHDILRYSIAKLREFLFDRVKELYLYKQITFDIFNILIDTIRIRQCQDFNIQAIQLDVIPLIKIDSIEQIMPHLNHYLNLLLSFVKDNPVEKNELLDQITSYINTEYQNPNFSVKGMAEHFSMKLSTISQHFKDNSGITITQYCTDLKLIKAKQILTTSDKPLNEVLHEIGYYDASSFIRKFKKYFGITPKEYRNKFFKDE